jgi:hypothetical protein
MPYAANTLPTTRPLGDNDSMRALLWNGVPSLETGLGARVFAFGEAYAALVADYPHVARYVYMYHPDLQGPLDICELLWGGEMFYAMYDEPELVHEVLALITEVYTAFRRRPLNFTSRLVSVFAVLSELPSVSRLSSRRELQHR